jgi:hypothetical protein
MAKRYSLPAGFAGVRFPPPDFRFAMFVRYFALSFPISDGIVTKVEPDGLLVKIPDEV